MKARLFFLLTQFVDRPCSTPYSGNATNNPRYGFYYQ